jgi:hypothetical protein
MGIEISSLTGGKANKKYAEKMVKFNAFLDGDFAKSLKLRSVTESLIYNGAYYGSKAQMTAAKVFGGGGGGAPKRLTDAKKADLFDLNYTEEEEMVKEAVKQFAALVRESAEKADERFIVDEDIRKGFYELGLVYYLVPESLGGMMKEKSTVIQMMMLETLSHGDLGQALALYTPLSVLNAIVKWGSDAQQKELVPAYLKEEGFPQTAIAVNEPTALFSPYELATKAVKSGNGYKLTGVKNMVPLATVSEYFIVLADAGSEGIQAFIVDKGAAGLTVADEKGMGLNTAQLGELKLEGVEVDASAMLGAGSGFDYEEFTNLSKLGWCALSVGCSQAVLDYVIPYANDRTAFGEPISHRQAVAFIISDIKIELDSMRILTQRAASKAEQGLTFAKETYLAHIMCSDKSMNIGSDGVQLLGGHGFIRDFPVQRWYRDLRAVAIAANGVHI